MLLSCRVFVSKLALFIWIDLLFFRNFHSFSDLAAVLFCIASVAMLSFASVFKFKNCISKIPHGTVISI